MPVKEFDLAAYDRKFNKTITMNEMPNRKVAPVIVDQVGTDDDRNIIFVSGKETIVAKPVYHHFSSGYYYSKKYGWVCVYRRMNTSFKVGLSNENYHMYAFVPSKESWQQINTLDFEFDKKVDYEESVNHVGPIGKRLFVSASRLFYLTTPIALRDGNMFILSDDSLQQEVSDVLRNLRYRGVECQLNNL